jgi:hypothetical protein
LAHLDKEQRNAWLKRFSETGEIDVAGVPITEPLFAQILAAAPRDADNHPTFKTARFRRATFQGLAEFRDVIFEGHADFVGATFSSLAHFFATFEGSVSFDKATFQDGAGFGSTFKAGVSLNEATFQGGAGFFRTIFPSDAEFLGATFQDAAFGQVAFEGDAGFIGATFQGHAGFNGATFEGLAGFDRATFQDVASFQSVTFKGHAGFDGAIFRRGAWFNVARFEQALQLGPLLVYGVLGLDAASFARLIHIEASARGLSCQRTRFPAGVQLRLRGARIVLDDADLPCPSILVGIAALSDDRLARREQRLVQAVRRLAPLAAVEFSARPRLLSVQGANVAGLTVSNVDLAECRFAGAHNLDRLRLEAKVTFSSAPVRLPWDWRQVIVEERTWRAAQSDRWALPQWLPAWLHRALRRIRPIGGSERWATRQWWPVWLHRPFGTEWPGMVPAGQIAGLYRALRKGREDAKDEPGAADFYYGEMEMRRRAGRPTDSSADNPGGDVSGGQVERAILTVYWLVSGYGLRAWRALAFLVVTVILAAVALRAVGFTHHRHPWSSAFLYTVGAITHLVNPPDGLLTEPGQAIRIAIGVLGPVLLGLGLLALRGRIKR